MNLRILKKKSKQAVPLLAHFGYKRSGFDFFPAGKDENYHGVAIPCARCRSKECWCTAHPLKGTPMYGGMDGGESPEWSEKSAFEVLCDCVGWWGGKPDSMTDDEWRRALRVTRVIPLSDEEIRQMAEDVDER